MKAPIKWFLRIAGGLVAVVLIVCVYVYFKSNSVLAQKYTFREVPVLADTDSALLARGEHITKTGCLGCHGNALQGHMFIDDPVMARAWAPNLAARARNYSDSELAGFLRHGVKKDGTSPLFMPPAGMKHVSDYDLAAIVEYLRTLPSAADSVVPVRLGPVGRALVAFGLIKPATEMMDTAAARVGDDSTYTTTRRGEYIARTVCASCHGHALLGEPGPGSPALAGALGYSLPEFTALLRTGTPRVATTKLTIMAEVAKSDLKNFTDEEIAAIHGYLSTLGAGGAAGATKP
jgi:mono/diheme cytochrome c family protein